MTPALTFQERKNRHVTMKIAHVHLANGPVTMANASQIHGFVMAIKIVQMEKTSTAPNVLDLFVHMIGLH